MASLYLQVGLSIEDDITILYRITEVYEIMKLIFFVQMRAGSSRLPKKYRELLLNNLSLSQFIMSRVRSAAKKLNATVILSTGNEKDDYELIEHLDGFYDKVIQTTDINNICLRLSSAIDGNDALVRFWGDCPLFCNDVLESVVSYLLQGSDFVSSSGPECKFAKGLDLEGYSFKAISRLNSNLIKDPRLKEFPSLALKNDNTICKKNVVSKLNSYNFQLTVDYQSDLDRVKKIVSTLDENTLWELNEAMLFDFAKRGFDLIGEANLNRNVEYSSVAKSLHKQGI